ncbi:MAG TPA: ABC transporter substrate-binding protein, partial [Methylomirabilota bacterium]|nr:ABC transporter substrate-binding protein [Methylomirabilota bacterium]
DGCSWPEPPLAVLLIPAAEGRAQTRAQGLEDRLALPGSDLASLKVDVICSEGTPATQAAQRATRTIPIVFGGAAFPDQTGLVASLARPGGNLTGVTFVGPEYGKRLELLREVSPKVARVALLYNDHNRASLLAVEETREWAQALHVTIEAQGVHDRASLDVALTAVRRSRPDALMTTADPLLASYRQAVVEFAATQRLLAMYGERSYVSTGGLMFYGTSTTDMWRRAAVYVDRILRGAKPGDLPVERPTTFELWINKKTARTLGLTLPPSVLLRADRVLD